MTAALSIIAEVEGALHSASSEKRTDILRRVTDLFVASSGNTDEQQVKLFDGVFDGRDPDKYATSFKIHSMV